MAGWKKYYNAARDTAETAYDFVRYGAVPIKETSFGSDNTMVAPYEGGAMQEAQRNSYRGNQSPNSTGYGTGRVVEDVWTKNVPEREPVPSLANQSPNSAGSGEGYVASDGAWRPYNRNQSPNSTGYGTGKVADNVWNKDILKPTGLPGVDSVLARGKFSGQQIINAFIEDAKKELIRTQGGYTEKELLNTGFNLMRRSGYGSAADHPDKIYDFTKQ